MSLKRRTAMKAGLAVMAGGLAMPTIVRPGFAATPVHTLKLVFADTVAHPVYQRLQEIRRRRQQEDGRRSTGGRIRRRPIRVAGQYADRPADRHPRSLCPHIRLRADVVSQFHGCRSSVPVLGHREGTEDVGWPGRRQADGRTSQQGSVRAVLRVVGLARDRCRQPCRVRPQGHAGPEDPRSARCHLRCHVYDPESHSGSDRPVGSLPGAVAKYRRRRSRFRSSRWSPTSTTKWSRSSPTPTTSTTSAS